MKNKLLLLTISAILLMTIMSNVANAEVYLYNDIIKDVPNSLVKYHAYYWFDDTSARGIGKQKDVPIVLWYDVQALPYNLVSGQVDWCNLTIKQYKNIYGTNFVAFQGFFGGDLLNTTTETQSYLFTNGSATSGQITINMRDKDSLTADMSCHYTNVNELYFENSLIGRFTTFMPSFECEGCTDYTLEEQSNAIDTTAEVTINELEIYDKIQTFVGWNFQIWLIASWIIKIGFILLAVGLVFAGCYFFYIFLLNLSKEI